jgi:ADP-ribose pyrophosphatase YjhB (NUDIX family)
MFETKAGIIKPIVYVGIVNGNKLLLVDYVTAPNPNKTGWWIPAPGMEFGEDPKDKAESVCKDFGLTVLETELVDVESFVLPSGWHLICHYLTRTNSEPSTHPNVKRYKWVTSEQLSEMTDMAHGKWEIGVGKKFLAAGS